MDYRANCFFYPEINLTWYSWGQCLVLFVKMMMWEFAVVIISLQNGKERLFTTCTKDIVYAGRHSHFYMDQQAQNPSHQRAFLWKWNIYQRAWNTGKQPKQSLSFKRILGIFFSLYKTILSSMLLFCQVVYPVLSITMWRYYYLLITRRYYYNCRTCMHIREQTYTHTHMHIIEQWCLTDFLLISFTETQYFKSTKKTLYSTIWDSFCSWHTFCFIRFLQQI